MLHCISVQLCIFSIRRMATTEALAFSNDLFILGDCINHCYGHIQNIRAITRLMFLRGLDNDIESMGLSVPILGKACQPKDGRNQGYVAARN